MEPINYLAQVADPFAASLKGYAATDAILNAEAKRAEVLRLQQLQQQQQQQLAQEQARFFANPNPTMRDAARYASLLTPEQSKAFQPFMEGISKEQQQGFLKTSGRLLSLMQFNPEMAAKEMNTLAIASRNSGDEADASLYEQMAQAAVKPEGKASVFISLASRAAGVPGAKEMFEAYDKASGTAREQALFPSKLKESTAAADKAAVIAKFAESNAVVDLTKKGWDITKIQEDIKIAKQNANIAALNAATAKETNALKRQENELKLQDMIDKRDATVRQVTAEVESARGDMDNFLNTANRILQTPKEVINSATGPIASRLPTTGQATADFEGLVETLGSQAFMSQIPKMKGSGALSEREGDKLQASLQNLSLKQSPDRLIENVKESMRLIEKARKTLSIKSGLPDTPLDIPSLDLNVTVGGKTYSFPTKEAADAYKKAAGIK